MTAVFHLEEVLLLSMLTHCHCSWDTNGTESLLLFLSPPCFLAVKSQNVCSSVFPTKGDKVFNHVSQDLNNLHYFTFHLADAFILQILCLFF